MSKLMYLRVSAMLVLLCLTRTAEPTPTVFIHQGTNNPTNEGFTAWLSGGPTNSVGPVFQDGQSKLDAWMIDDQATLTGVRYDVRLNPSDVSALNSTGWKLSARVRVPDSNVLPGFQSFVAYINGISQFHMLFGSDAVGDPIISLGEQESTFTVVGVAGDYHLYELVDSDANGRAELYIDYSLCYSDFAGLFNDYVVFSFGDTSTNQMGRSNWNYVSLITIPEPASAVQVGLAIVFFAIIGSGSRRKKLQRVVLAVSRRSIRTEVNAGNFAVREFNNSPVCIER